MKKTIPLSKIVPKGRTLKQCRATLRREGIHHEGRRWEFTPKKAQRIQSLLSA
jgi:hypothetical protein